MRPTAPVFILSSAAGFASIASLSRALPTAAVSSTVASFGFDTALLARLDRLRLLARRPPTGGQHAERRSRRRQHGSSLEFADYREYSPGDDPRRIDWNSYGRLDRLFLKLYEEEEDLPVHLLIDASASMRWTPDFAPGSAESTRRPSKFDLARRLAAALAYVGLGRLDRVSLRFFGGGGGASPGADPSLGLTRGKSQFHRALDFLARPPAAPAEGAAAAVPTDLRASLGDFSKRTRRAGLAIVFSDFFDPSGGHLDALARLLHRRFELQLVHTLDPVESDPLAGQLRGDLRLLDAESPLAYEITADDTLLLAYRREFEAFLDGLRDFCTRRGAGYTLASTAVPLEDHLTRMLRAGLVLGR